MRLVAAMAEPRLGASRTLFDGVEALGTLTPYAGDAPEVDVRYFRRRAAEEHLAAHEASGPEARAAHRELAARYAGLADRTMPSRYVARMPSRTSAPRHLASSARVRLSDLLIQRFGLAGGDGRQDRKLLGSTQQSEFKERKKHETRI